MNKIKALEFELNIELARRSFWHYCKLLAPDFYKEDRTYLKELCYELQEFYEDNKNEKVLIVNIPPRHGKTRTVNLFITWVFGKDKTQKIMTGSYNEMLSTESSKVVRNTIVTEKADEDKVVYSDIFPDTKIKYGDGAMNKWALEGGYSNYLATSPSGTATGFGASIIIIDDLIKNSMEAFNENVLANHWAWFTNTMLSRLEEGGKIILVMTRWSTNDLAGRALRHYENSNVKVRHICKKAYNEETDTMLCSEVLSKETYKENIRAMSEEVASANYQQIPVNLKGVLYTRFKTYESVPKDSEGNPVFESIRAYIDTADTGSDYLCSIIYGVYNREAYILDVYYTKEAMEVTEYETAKRLYMYKVNVADIESNNGGRGFARAVERHLREDFDSNYTRINWFFQSANKQARILSNSTWVQDHIYYPLNWKDRFPEFHNSMVTYQKEGKNLHDDGQDCITGVAETLNKPEKKARSAKGLRSRFGIY